jgi:hypothetical protein
MGAASGEGRVLKGCSRRKNDVSLVLEVERLEKDFGGQG